MFRIICSDVMARGLDIEDVQCVINYDMPTYIKSYVHRCGRTARAGKSGTAYTFARKEEVAYFRQILKKAEGGSAKKMKVDRSFFEPYLNQYKNALIQLKTIIQQEKLTKNLPNSHI